MEQKGIFIKDKKHHHFKKNRIMKNHLSIIKLLIVFVTVMSCGREDNNNLDISFQSKEFYNNYFKTEMLKNGVVETGFFKIPKLHFDQPWMASAAHAEFISKIDETVVILKKSREETLKRQINEVNNFIEIIKEHNLVEKEKFYQELISKKSDLDKLIFYQKEYNKYIKSWDKNVLVINDPKKPIKRDNKYNYLLVIAKNSDGDYIFDTDKYKKEDLQYSIEKYDKEFQKDGFYKSSRHIPDSKNGVLVRK